jgi:DNA-binding transcriptional ArsR family regulator
MASSHEKKLKQVIDPTLAKAFTHPLRSHIWVVLFERGIVSPAEIANELELDVSDVSYHFRGLRKRGLIRLVRTARRRGFDEHFYEPVAPAFEFDDTEWMRLPEGVRSSLSGEAVRQIIEQLTKALEGGSFDARSRHLSQNYLLADEQGWDELMSTAQWTLDRIQAIRSRCAERRKASGEAGVPVAVLMTAFETAPDDDRPPSGEAGSR